jgi:hypothetical protein
MGSTPTYTLKADLNGTGTLVDISAYVEGTQGVAASVGRTDWTTSEPAAGTLTLTLNNIDGRFTPGNTAVYTVGCVTGMVVEWTVGARVRRYRAGVPALAFPTATSGLSTVTVSCLDALALLGARVMRSMLAEQIHYLNPICYYPLSESGNALDPRPTDESGYAQPQLVPTSSTSGAEFGWGTATGPRYDGRSALALRGDATVPPTDSAALSMGTSLSGTPIEILAPTYTDGVNPPASDTVGNAYYTDSWGHYLWAVSFWFNCKDVYGAASTTAGITDGPYVELGTIVGTGVMVISVRLRIPDRRLLLCVAGEGTGMRELSTDDYTLAMGQTHHVAIVFKGPPSGALGKYVCAQGYVDGVQLTSSTAPGGNYMERPAYFYLAESNGSTAGSGSDTSRYPLAGSISHWSIHGPPDVANTTSVVTTPATLPGIDQMYGLGMVGPLEPPETRFARIMGWLDSRYNVGNAVEGTSQGVQLGSQATDGKTMLAAVCDALRTEDAQVDTATVAGVDTVQAWLTSTQRPGSASITIDAEADAEGSPELSYDTAGVAGTVTTTGYGDTRAVWKDTTVAGAKYADTSATVSTALQSPIDLLLLAQYRTLRGRATSITPTKITVNATTSKANLTATLLSLTPGARITVSNLPSTVLGFTTIDCFLSGVSEKHDLDGASFDLILVPLGDAPADYLDTTERRAVEQVSTGAPNVLPFVDSTGFDAVTTTFTWVGYPATGADLSQNSADYPLYIRVASEVIKLTTAAGAPTLRGAGPYYNQTVTGAVRGQDGTTAAIHGIYDTLDLWDITTHAVYAYAEVGY